MKKKKSQQIFYWGMILFISVSMAWQVYRSLIKVTAYNTGTETTLMNLNTALNLSFTICKASYGSDTSPRIEPLLSVQSQDFDRNLNWTQIHDNSNTSNTIFAWYRDKNLVCTSIPLQGDEIKLVHSYGYEKNMFVYLHEPGLFDPEFELEIRPEWLKGNSILSLDLHRFEKIPDFSTCSDDRSYDECRLGYITDALFSTIGCVLPFSRLNIK